MKIAIITAVPEEFRAVACSLGTSLPMKHGMFRAGHFSSDKHDFLLVESGIGFDNAARAVEALIHDGLPDLLISTGFCGGIGPELQLGDIVVAKRIIIADESGFDEVPVQLCSSGQTFVAHQAAIGKRVVAGTFVSNSSVPSKKQLAGMLPIQFPNSVVEMGSGAIAVVAAENGIPLLAIRAVRDTAEEEFGFSLDEFCDSGLRRIRPYRVLLTALKKPHIIPELLRLNFNSRRAADSLAAVLPRLYSAL